MAQQLPSAGLLTAMATGAALILGFGAGVAAALGFSSEPAAAWMQAFGSVAAILAGFATILWQRLVEQRALRRRAAALADSIAYVITRVAQSLRDVEARRAANPHGPIETQFMISLQAEDEWLQRFPVFSIDDDLPELESFAGTLASLSNNLRRAIYECEQANAELQQRVSIAGRANTLADIAVDARNTVDDLHSRIGYSSQGGRRQPIEEG